MKNTMVFTVLFVLMLGVFPKTALALLIPQIDQDIKLVVTLAPTATPTPMVFKKIDPNIEFKLISTLTPTQSPVVVTQIVTPTEAEVSPTIAQEMDVEPTVTPTEAEEKPEENKTDLKTWFMNITLGLLVLIILIQIWPKKKIV
jgi:hypothetical protein